MRYLGAVLLSVSMMPAALPAHSAPSRLAEDADRDVVCYAYKASEASAAKEAGDSDKFATLLSQSMFFRGISAERYKTAAEFGARRDAGIADLALALKYDGKSLLEAECNARMRVALGGN